MATWKLNELSRKMKDLDICMLSTQGDDGDINARPMSNNGDVEYDGHSFFFTSDKFTVAKDIEENNKVGLTFNGKDKLYIAVIGEADLIDDKEEMKEHWTRDLEKWFEDGLDTPDLVMIRVKASTIRYWQGEEQGEIPVE
jgi:general stress protein 26